MTQPFEHTLPHFVDEPSAGFPDWLMELPGDRLLSVEHVPFHAPEHTPSIEEIMSALTNVGSFDRIGTAGMPLASKAFDQSLGEGLYEAEFARDGLIMAAFTDQWLPRLTEATVRRLAEVQGTHNVFRRDKPAYDLEEVGRVPHEIRAEDDPMAAVLTAQHGWDWPYFGSVDAAPLFLSAIVRCARRDPRFLDIMVEQRDGFTRSIREVMLRSAEWVVTRLDAQEHGLLSSRMASNSAWQVWADSIDAYHQQNGALARGELAVIEVQAWAFDALLDVADFLEEFNVDTPVPAHEYRDDAHILRRRAIDQLWINDKGGYFASAYQYDEDGYVGPLTVRTANMAVPLRGGFLIGDEFRPKVEALARQVSIMGNGLRCPSGVRTLAADETRFRPYGYHNGSVWPWQNLWIAEGLRQHGFTEEATDLERSQLKIVDQLGCYPEYVQGDEDIFGMANEAQVMIRSLDGNGSTYVHGAMQPAQKFQGWTVFGMYAAMQRLADG